MLRYSNVCCRYLGAAARFGARRPNDTLLKAGTLSHSKFDSFRRKSTSAAQQHLFDEEEQLPEPSNRPPRIRPVGTGPEESLRNVRLAKGLEFARKQRKNAKREVRGNNERISLLTDLAKARGLPDGVNPTVVSKELEWLKDPKELGMRVAKLLSGGNIALAVAMIRRAESQEMVTSGAWNNLLKYCFKEGAPLAAFKFYNDVRSSHLSPRNNHPQWIPLLT